MVAVTAATALSLKEDIGKEEEHRVDVTNCHRARVLIEAMAIAAITTRLSPHPGRVNNLRAKHL